MLDFMKPDGDPGALWLVNRLTEMCPGCVRAALDDDRCEVTLDSAQFDVVDGLVVGCGGRKFKLLVRAEEVT